MPKASGRFSDPLTKGCIVPKSSLEDKKNSTLTLLVRPVDTLDNHPEL
jgi:hypothetical protein